MQPDYYKNLKLHTSKSSRGIFLNAKQVFEGYTITYVRRLTSSIFLQKREYSHSCTSTFFFEKRKPVLSTNSSLAWDKAAAG